LQFRRVVRDDPLRLTPGAAAVAAATVAVGAAATGREAAAAVNGLRGSTDNWSHLIGETAKKKRIKSSPFIHNSKKSTERCIFQLSNGFLSFSRISCFLIFN